MCRFTLAGRDRKTDHESSQLRARLSQGKNNCFWKKSMSISLAFKQSIHPYLSHRQTVSVLHIRCHPTLFLNNNPKWVHNPGCQHCLVPLFRPDWHASLCNSQASRYCSKATLPLSSGHCTQSRGPPKGRPATKLFSPLDWISTM